MAAWAVCTVVMGVFCALAEGLISVSGLYSSQH